MNGETDELSFCSACKSPMDVTMLPPYTNVQCPECGEHTRIKVDLGPYTLNKRVGSGGMSLVFRAKDKNLGRQVAIKILNEEYSMDQQRITQFEQEAKITAAISHPHCVRMYTVGQAFRRFYIAMELVPGGSLEELMSAQGAVSEDKILPVAMQVNEGLEAAYQAGLIHRDIKPGNILFDADGHVKIVDFGLALVTQGGAAKADEIWATPYYVSPETLDNLEEDFRSDMYALGATLYHALSGKPPFETETRSTSELKEIKQTIPSLSEVAPWLSEETCYAVDRAMKFAPADRFSSYSEMFSALEIAENLIRTRGSQPPKENAARPKRRIIPGPLRKWIAPGIVALGVFLITGIFMALRDMGDSSNNSNGSLSGETVGEDHNQELWVKIGKDYLTAQNLMKRGKYSAAGIHFSKLMRDENVVEPTASVACLQATVSLLLDGRSWEARKLVKEKTFRDSKHAERDNFDEDLSLRIKQGMERLTRIDHVEPSEMPQVTDQVGFILTFASALKNWEQGRWTESVKLFESVRRTPLNEDLRDLQYYKGIGQDYLSEYKRLKPYLEGFEPKSRRDVDRMQQTVNELNKSLKTKGRSQLQVRVWREQLERFEAEFAERANNVAKKPVEVNQDEESNIGGDNEDFTQLKGDVESLLDTRNFSKIVKLLSGKELKTRGRRRWKQQVAYLSAGAANFIRSIEKNTEGAEFFFQGVTVAGVAFEEVKGSSPRGLSVDLNGERQLIAWHELTNETMLSLYSATRREKATEKEEQIRLEDAICFAWLVGERERAKLAADSLIEQLDDGVRFKKRWLQIVELFDVAVD